MKREELEAFNLVIKTPQEVLTRKSEDFRCLAALKNCVVKTLNFVQGVPTSLEYAKCHVVEFKRFLRATSFFEVEAPVTEQLLRKEQPA